MSTKTIHSKIYPDKVYYTYNPEEKILGMGGMGIVYYGKRYDEKGNIAEVAIKVMKEDLPKEVIERAQRESSILIKNDHLVMMYEFVSEDDTNDAGQKITRNYVISEFLHGVTLGDLIRGGRSGLQLTEEQESLYERLCFTDKEKAASEITMGVLSGVMALHDSGYIHRDIDPSNIMITTDSKVRLFDFGIAKKWNTLNSMDTGLTSSGQFLGKAAYAAPEIVKGDIKNQGKFSDVYAIGILYFLLITGHLPFSGTTYEKMDAQLHKRIPYEQIPNLRIRNIIRKATEKKQSIRYPSSAHFRAAIEDIDFTNKSRLSWWQRIFM